MAEVNIGAASGFNDPGRKVIAVGSAEIGVFKIGGEFRAYHNHCPHMGGPACQGKMMPKVEEDIAPDQTSRGMSVLQGTHQHRVPVAWLRIRHSHRAPCRQRPHAAAAGRGTGVRRR